MKLHIRSLLFILIPFLGNAQVNSEKLDGPYFGVYQQDNGPCLSIEQRTQIQHRLAENRKILLSEGKLPVSRNAIVSFNWPLKQAVGFDYNAIYGISNFVDQDPAFPNQLEDYFCGQRTYDLASGYNHQGVDIFLWPFPWHMVNNEQAEVVAAAAGTIIGKDDGNVDTNCDFSSPNWNAVYVQHVDGSTTWYGHMKNGSLTTKGVGATVQQGEYLGIAASSGSSTGPHLHFETYDSGSNLIDPYFVAGGCNNLNASSWWASQKDYYDSQINTILIHHAPPVFNACPTPATTNIAECYQPGSQVFFAAYYHDQLAGQLSSYKVYRPNGTVYSSWTHASTAAHYQASYWYWFTTLPLSAATGTWTFEVTYAGETVSRNFLVQNSCVLPVALKSFTARKVNKTNARLEWVTESEQENLGFEIERSQDGKLWESIAWIEGLGNSWGEVYYRYDDSAPLTGLNYYRLRQEDFSGKAFFSETRSVEFYLDISGIRIFPNPVAGELNLDVGGAEKLDSEIAIFNASGELVYLAMPDQREILVSQLSPGVYFLETRIGNQRIIKRFVRY
ncbi:MAG: peptidoglycan DD-metalloendopeptidase family protein [Saprospiraceae bacterium]|nr:peptidoglycan DD-metalloendopeptidase family protein [Saprospiraceae bacterium]